MKNWLRVPRNTLFLHNPEGVPPWDVCAGRASFDEALLFTHRGLSGPAVLQASSYWHEGEPIVVDLRTQELVIEGLAVGVIRDKI